LSYKYMKQTFKKVTLARVKSSKKNINSCQMSKLFSAYFVFYKIVYGIVN